MSPAGAILKRHRAAIETLSSNSDDAEPYLYHCSPAGSRLGPFPGLRTLGSREGDGGLVVRYLSLRTLLRTAFTIAENLGLLSVSREGTEGRQRQEKVYDESRGDPTPVAVLVDSGPLLAALELGVLFSGRPFMPLDAGDPRCGLILASVRPAVVVVPDSSVAAELAFRDQTARTVRLSELLSSPTACTPPSLDDSGRCAHIYHTSGSTALPKGCLVSDAALATYAERKPVLHGIGAASTVMITSPMTFDPQWGDLVSSLAAGAKVVTIEKEVLLNGELLFAAMERTGTTHVCTTPSVWRNVPVPRETGYLKLQVVALGGERTPRKLAEAWHNAGVKVLNTYGVTECCVYQAVAEFRSDLPGSERLLGVPVDPGGIMLRKLGNGEADADAMDRTFADHELLAPDELERLSSAGTLAEIVLVGTMVGRYLGDPASEPVGGFVEHSKYGRCFYTGDLVSMSPRGAWFLAGRHASDTRIKLVGRRADILEIEATLSKAWMGIVKDLCVSLVGSTAATVLACACVAAEPVSVEHATLWERLLRELALPALPSHLVPGHFILVEGLPIARTGKLDRKAVRCLLEEQVRQREDQELESGDGTGHGHAGWLAAVTSTWRSVLNIAHDPSPKSLFAEWGGDSFACTRACALLWTEFRRNRAPRQDTEDGVVDDEDAGKWGEKLPASFGPGELMKQPRLTDWAAHFRDRFGPFAATTSDADGAQDGPPNMSSLSIGPRHALSELDALFRHACTLPSLILAAFLLERGVMPDLGLLNGSATPLHASLNLGHAAIALLLLDRGADPLRRGPEGMLPVHFAVHGSLNCPAKEAETVLRALLARGARIDARDSDGGGTLHHAARAGVSRGMFGLLVSLHLDNGGPRKGGKKATPAGAAHPLASRDSHGRTPLHWATLNGHRTLVQLLLEQYRDVCSVDAKDNDGETALAMAMRRARCGAEERGGRGGAMVWGDIAGLLGGGGSTKEVKGFAKAAH
ncbi:hypothetical protein DFJ74DRAFT_437930 [Hyaloraphidium curvatum]|nr:hypothetical protein DFJ74DRAFT_437930 [Hyaloraphidium curvatum]